MNPVLTPDLVSPPEEAISREALLTLCHELEAAGIWLYLQSDTTLIAGPPELVHRRPDLLQQLRTHKAAIVRVLQDCLVVETFDTAPTDTRFAYEVCPECQRSCLVLSPPRRLEVHRTPDNRAVCPGSERAQAAVAQTILTAFVTDRCVQRPYSVLTWHSLRGALQAWCRDRGWLLESVWKQNLYKTRP